MSAAVYTLVMISTVMIRYTGVPSAERRLSLKADFVEGFRYMLVENRTVLALVVMAMGPLAFPFSYIVLLPVFVTERLGMDASALGGLQSIAAVGALAGGLWLASLRNVRHKGRIMVVTGTGYGMAILVMAGLPFPILAFAVVVLVGVFQTIFRTANNTALLEITPTRFQGRVVSITFLDMGVQALAGILAGAVTDVWGVEAGLAVLGVLCVVFVWAVAMGVPAVRRL